MCNALYIRVLYTHVYSIYTYIYIIFLTTWFLRDAWRRRHCGTVIGTFSPEVFLPPSNFEIAQKCLWTDDGRSCLRWLCGYHVLLPEYGDLDCKPGSFEIEISWSCQKKLQFKLKISDKLHSHALGLHQIKSLSDRRGRFGSACRSWLLGPHVGVRQDLNSLEAAAALPAPPVSGCVVEHRWPALSGQGKQIDTFMQIVLVPSPASKGTASTWTERCEHCLHSCIFHKESRLCYL